MGDGGSYDDVHEKESEVSHNDLVHDDDDDEKEDEE